MNLYFRLLKILLLAFWERACLGVFEESKIWFRCWPNDLDSNLHMNNGRYLTLLDIGRMDLTIRTGLLRQMLKNRWNPVAGGVLIRYRRPIAPFQKFEIRTRVLGWDSKWFYLQQRFYGLDGKLIAAALVKAVFLGKMGSVPPAELARSMGHTGESPALPEAVAKWNSADEVLS